MSMYAVHAPYGVFGFETVLDDGIEGLGDEFVVRAAPIIRYVVDWPADRAKCYFESRGWTVSEVVPALLEATS